MVGASGTCDRYRAQQVRVEGIAAAWPGPFPYSNPELNAWALDLVLPHTNYDSGDFILEPGFVSIIGVIVIPLSGCEESMKIYLEQLLAHSKPWIYYLYKDFSI